MFKNMNFVIFYLLRKFRFSIISCCSTYTSM